MLKTLKKKSKRLKIIRIRLFDFLKYQLWIYTIVFTSIFLCAWMFDRWIEAVMFCIAHTCIRQAFKKQFHFNSTAYCLTLTLAIVWFAIPITLPIEISLLSSIAIAFVICLFGYLAQDRVDLLKATKSKKFNFKHCTKEEMIEICNELGYSKDKQEIAIMLFVDKLKNKQVWEILCNTQRNIEWSSVNKCKYRIKKDINRFLKEKD